jgi:molybdopterin converting factor small subunit
MKSSYELAMERLSKNSPATKLSATQKKQLAELDAKYTAKIAEREIALRDEINRLAGSGEDEKIGQLQQQLVSERKKIQAELEDKKERVRQA